MLFGLTNTLVTYIRLVNNILREYLDRSVVAYLDDILIYSKTREEYKEHVKKVIEVLDKAGLRLKPEKCQFYIRRGQFLGYIISLEEITIDEEKVRVIRD